MKSCIALLISILLVFPFPSLTYGDTSKQSRPDNLVPIGIMGDHGHKKSEIMLLYRFMAINMQGLQSDTTPLEKEDVLKDFMIAPVQMSMQMHMLETMFAPHNRITLMAMANYQHNAMQMEGAHQHAHGGHEHPVVPHEMSSAGIGDVKLEGVLTLWEMPHLTLLANVGVSFPTDSITQKGDNEELLPYSMQLGNGSFEARPGITLFGFHNFWSYGGQLRGTFPLNTNAGGWRYGKTFDVTAWGARRINNWISLGSRLLLSARGNITGSHPDLNPYMSPSHRPDYSGATLLNFAVSGNVIVPTGTFIGQRLAIEFQIPLYQSFTGIQLKTTWQLTASWQYAFKVL